MMEREVSALKGYLVWMPLAKSGTARAFSTVPLPTPLDLCHYSTYVVG